MSHEFTPRGEQRYREETAKSSSPGVMSPRFICTQCRTSCTTHGRKKKKSGYVCRYCLMED